MCIFVVCQSYTLRAPSLQKKNFKDKLVKEGVHGGNAAKNLAKNQNPTISIAIPKVILHNFSGEVFLLLHCTTHTIYIWADLGAKYLAFFSSFLKTRKKNISFAQFVYFLREVCLLFNLWMIKFTIMSKKNNYEFKIKKVNILPSKNVQAEKY